MVLFVQIIIEIPQLLDAVADVPVVRVVQVLMGAVVEETVALPQFLHGEKIVVPQVVDIPVVAQMQIPFIFPWSFFSCSTLIRWSTFLECSRGGDSRAPTVALVEKFVEWGSSSSR